MIATMRAWLFPDISEAESKTLRYAELGKEALDIALDNSSDNETILEMACELGLVSKEIREKPCGDDCYCNAMHLEFPLTCYKPIE